MFYHVFLQKKIWKIASEIFLLGFSKNYKKFSSNFSVDSSRESSRVCHHKLGYFLRYSSRRYCWNFSRGFIQDSLRHLLGNDSRKFLRDSSGTFSRSSSRDCLGLIRTFHQDFFEKIFRWCFRVYCKGSLSGSCKSYSVEFP